MKLRILAFPVAVLLAIALGASSATAAPTVTGEFKVSSLNTNNKLTVGPDNNIWLTLEGANDVARITPTGKVDEFDLGATEPSGIATAEGKLWITRNGGVTSFLPGNPVGSKAETGIAQIT